MDITTMDRGQLTLTGSGCCTLLTMHFTVQVLSQHLFYWKNPQEQKAIIIIVLMAPIYAVYSFVGLMDVQESKAFFMLLDSIKDCYAALVIAKFVALMYSYLNISIRRNMVPDKIKGREFHHLFPMSLVMGRSARLDNHTLKLLKYGAWQFVVIRPVFSVLMIAVQLLGLYNCWIRWTFIIILNISASLAVYTFVQFYRVFAEELQPHKPLTKFLCVQGIVFFCFKQGVVLEVLVKLGIIQAKHFWLDVEHLEEAIQNVLVCFEMVVFSVLQLYAFHVAPYSGDVEQKFKLRKNE